MGLIQLTVTPRDAGRLLGLVRERRQKLSRGLLKFRDNFDEAKGANMRDAHDALVVLENNLNEVIHGKENHPRRAGRDPS